MGQRQRSVTVTDHCTDDIQPANCRSPPYVQRRCWWSKVMKTQKTKKNENICAVCRGSFNMLPGTLSLSLSICQCECECLNCNISKSYQRLFVLNFSPVCLCGEVFQNGKPWRQGGHHPPAAGDFTRTPTIITVHTICSNSKLHNTSQTNIYGASALPSVQIQVHRYSAFNKSFFLNSQLLSFSFILID